MPNPSDSGSPSSTAFRFEVPSQPPSWNTSYRIVKVPHRGGGSHLQLAKTDEGWNYQLVASTIARRAKPLGWQPTGQVRVRYWFRLKRAMDATNCLKLLEDAIAEGLGVNDSIFLPSVEELTTGNKDPGVTIEVQAL